MLVKRLIYTAGVVATLVALWYVFAIRHARHEVSKIYATRSRVGLTLRGAEDYYLAHSEFPTSTAQIAEFPIDYKEVFAAHPKWVDANRNIIDEWGQPLRLRLLDGGKTIQIYSIGPNGIDQGGHRAPGDDYMLEKSTAGIVTMERIQAVLVGALEYRNSHQTLPTNIAEVVESADFQQRYPAWSKWVDTDKRIVDEWGRPLRLQVRASNKKLGGSFAKVIRIYSVGENGIDEGGKNGPDGKGGSYDDWMREETVP